MRDMFDTLVRSTLTVLDDDMAQAEAEAPVPAVVPGADIALLAALREDLLADRICTTCHKTLIYEFHQFRAAQGLPVDPESSTAFLAYREQFGPQTVEAWFATYPELARMLRAQARDVIEFTGGFWADLARDYQGLVTRGLLRADAPITSISAMGSDPHNGGRVVLCLEQDGERVLLYKPRPAGLDEGVAELFDHVLELSEEMGGSPVPDGLSGEDSTWQRFVRKQSVTADQVPQAYRNLGICAAVLTAIGASDLHDENLIFDGPVPRFIDLETAMHADHASQQTGLARDLSATLTHSVASTAILPVRMVVPPRGLLLGAINTPHPQTTREQLFEVRHAGTDAIDIARTEIEIPRLAVPLVLADGSSPHPLHYQRDFVEGYRHGYRRVMERREAVEALLDRATWPVRRIMRPTALYAQMLSALIFPKNLTSADAVDAILGHLRPQATLMAPEHADAILAQEKASLLRGDIPYFYVHADSTCVRSGDFVSGPLFESAPRDYAREALARMSEANLLQEERFIAEGFSEIRRMEPDGEFPGVEHAAPIFAEPLAQLAQDPWPLAERLADLAVAQSGETGATEEATPCGWMNGIYGQMRFSYAGAGLISLHDTGGLLALCERAAQLKPESPWAWRARSARAGLKSLRGTYGPALMQGGGTAVAGELSVDYLLGHGGVNLEAVGPECASVVAADDELGDVFSGALGTLLLLAGFPGTSREDLQKAAAVLRDRSSDLDAGGLAHGSLGQAWTRGRVARQLGDVDGVREALDDVLAHRFADGWDGAGWCNGVAGQLMVAAELAAGLDVDVDLRALARRAMALPENERSLDLSVCHGVAGVVQALIAAAQDLNDPWFLEQAEQYWGQALALAVAHGWYTGEPGADHLLGYVLGWGGVADTALALEQAKAGRRVWLPMQLRSSDMESDADLHAATAVLALIPGVDVPEGMDLVGHVDFGQLPVRLAMARVPVPDFDPTSERNRERVLMRVRAFSCNFRDKGLLAEFLTHPTPGHRFTPFGSEFCAEILAVGADVDGLRPGDRVMGNNAFPSADADGVMPGVATNYASLGLLILHQSKVLAVPDEMSDEQAATFSLGAQTAMGMLRLSGAKPGDRPVVLSARSSTGLFVAAALKAHHIEPTCVSTSPWTPEQVAALGVDAVVPPDASVLAANSATHVFDPFFDMNMPLAADLLETGGTYVTCGLRDQHPVFAEQGLDEIEINVRQALVLAIPKLLTIRGNCLGNDEDLRTAVQLYREHSFVPVMDRVYPPSQAGDFLHRSFFDRERFGRCALQLQAA